MTIHTSDAQRGEVPINDWNSGKSLSTADLAAMMALAQNHALRSPQPPTLAQRAQAGLTQAARAFSRLQRADGHWPGDYGGPLFLLPGLLMSCHITQTSLSNYQRLRMREYMFNVQNDDGGWGLHIASPSYVFGTTLNYIALRLLDVHPQDPRMQKARTWLHEHGGARGIPSWGKVWLATMNLYRWEGINPILPELWLLPDWVPIHPRNLWCHTRAVYLPMSYLYATRYAAPETVLIRELRQELFVEPWEQIDWPAQRDNVAATDLFSPPSAWLKLTNQALQQYENHNVSGLRQRALQRVSELIELEDAGTSYLDIGPVSKPLNMLIAWIKDPNGTAYQKHVARIEDYLWDGEDGMKMQGYNGSQFWDTAFAVRALTETHIEDDSVSDALIRAHRFIDANQVRHDVPDRKRQYRDSTRGAFPFSTGEQAWPVSDCTAEGIKAALALRPLVRQPISDARLAEAVDILLAYQNSDGGWSEYERARAGTWLEHLNAAEIYGRIMVAYSYVECTSACIQGLAAYAGVDPTYRKRDVQRAIARGQRYILKQQQLNGSWYGQWGVCFTYGTWFGIEGLLASGITHDHPAIRRACIFLLDKQREDGGWGESYRSCVEARWVEHEQSLVVNTAWAVLALMAARDPNRRAVERGIEFLLQRQRTEANGDGLWANESIFGVFNQTCMINYDNYRYVMPIWALARYLST